MKQIAAFPAIFLLLSVMSLSVSAQDWNKLNPDGTKILVDTTLIRSVIVTIAPGETIGPVTHPAHFAYILTDGKIKVYSEGKEPVTMDLKKGMAVFNDPQPSHKTENIGDKPFSFLIVELNEHPLKSKE